MANLLTKYFRQPGIHIKLPSGGHYNEPNEINLTSSGEVAIYPMTAADEIVLSNPDSLLNGVAIERIIQSCCPAVSNPKVLPVPDTDAIILASKLVSYGDGLHLVGKCPKCERAKEFTLSIRTLLDEAVPLPEQHSVRLNDDLVAYLRPYSLESNNKINLTQFQESKAIQALSSSDVSEEEKSHALSEAFDKITALNLQLLADSVLAISTPETVVQDHLSIKEFIDNTSRDVVKKLREGLLEFNKYGLSHETELTCDNKDCNTSWKTPIVYDPSSFFASDS